MRRRRASMRSAIGDFRCSLVVRVRRGAANTPRRPARYCGARPMPAPFVTSGDLVRSAAAMSRGQPRVAYRCVPSAVDQHDPPPRTTGHAVVAPWLPGATRRAAPVHLVRQAGGGTWSVLRGAHPRCIRCRSAARPCRGARRSRRGACGRAEHGAASRAVGRWCVPRSACSPCRSGRTRCAETTTGMRGTARRALPCRRAADRCLSFASGQGVHRCLLGRGISCGGQYSPLGHGI
jgi:hypothetical protein